MTTYRVHLSFAVVNEATLAPAPLPRALFGGRSSRREGGVTWTRGTADHVVDLASTWPSTALDALAPHFQASILAIHDELVGACLLPAHDGTPLGIRLEIDPPPSGFAALQPHLRALTGATAEIAPSHGRLPLGPVQETVTASLAVCAIVATALERGSSDWRGLFDEATLPPDYVTALSVILDRGPLAARSAEPLRRAPGETYRLLGRCLRDATPFI